VNYELQKLTPKEWENLAEDAHTTVFGENRPHALNRFHFVVIVLCNSELGGYFTCLEMDSETLYIQHGGVFPPFQKTIHAAQGYATFIKWGLENYKRLWTRIENTNEAMIKLALRIGFIITGNSNFGGKIYLELMAGELC
jgi:RimJ/RimL family protein N-acetyltransferase